MPTTIALAMAIVWALVLVFVPMLPREGLETHLWSLCHLARVPVWIRIVAAGLCVAVAIPAVNGRVWSRIEHAAVALRHWPAWMLIAGAGTLAFAVFWLLRCRNFALGDSSVILQVVTWDTHLQGAHVTYDEPLELLLHCLLYRFLHWLADVSVEGVYAAVSCLCGVAAMLLVGRLWRQRELAFDRWLVATGLVLSTAAVQLFFGYVENYTIVLTGMVAYVVLAERSLHGRLHAAWPALVLSLSMCFHLLAGWLLPSLVYLWLVRSRERTVGRSLAELGPIGLAVAVPLAATVGACSLASFGPEQIKHTHLWHLKFIFLLDESYAQNYYPMLSWRHLEAVLNQLLLVGLPGILALAAVALLPKQLRQGKTNGRFTGFLLVCAVFLQLFAATWHSDIGAARDWDLFAVIGLGYALLGAHLMTGRMDASAVRHVGLVIVVIAATLAGSWIAVNHRQRNRPSDPHAAAHLLRGARACQEGRAAEAEWDLREALRLDENANAAHLWLGQALLQQGRRREAAKALKAYLSRDPQRTGARMQTDPYGKQIIELGGVLADLENALRTKP